MWNKNEAALKRLGEVIKTDATTSSKGDFLATHAPFEALYLNGLTQISEQELLNDYLLAPERKDAHAFIMVQGGNGSGKTHLIRWLKEMYEASTDRQKEAVLLISRAHNNLQDAMTQLLTSDIFPKEISDRILKQLENARGNLSVSDFKKHINFNFHLAVTNDKSPMGLDRRTKDRLARYLLNQFVIDTFLMKEGGPLDRMRDRIETTDASRVVDGDAPVFLPEDFAITISQINTGMKSMGNRAEEAVIWMADQFTNLTRGKEMREKVANYLNTTVSSVIRNSMNLKSVDFQHIFEELRKDLKRKGMALTLFLEDINAFTGIDEALMEALLVDHTAEGNTDCCRLTSVVGSTIWFYENKLNSSIRERISYNVYLREGSVISAHHLDSFVARYINAIHLSPEEIDHWYRSGAVEQDLPLAPSQYPFSCVEINGKPYSIFPFTANALDRLYNELEIRDENNSSRTPRVVLNQIVQQVLTKWFSQGPGFLSSEKNFVNSVFGIPRWADDTYELSNKALSEDYVIERSLLLRIWGNGTTERVGNSIGGVSKEIFEAFEIPFPDVAETEPRQQKPEEPIPVQAPVPATSDAPKDERLKRTIDEINEWASDETKAPLRSHQDLRDDLVRFILTNSPWAEWNIPYKLAETWIQRRYVTIEGQSAALQSEQSIILPRNEETRFLLIALARWRYAGGNSWEFEYGLDYYTSAIAWLEKNRQRICDFIVRTKNSSTVEELADLGVAAQYCAKVFSGEFSNHSTVEQATVALFQTPVAFENGANRLNQWNEIAKNIKQQSELYPFALSFYRKAVGGRRAEEANYMFVDAYDLLLAVKKLRAADWSLDAVPSSQETEPGVRGQFTYVIDLVKNRKKDLFQESRDQAHFYRSYFSNEISQDLSTDSIIRTVQEIRAFLAFLSTQNMSYDSALSKAFNDQSLPGQVHDLLAKADEILTCRADAELLSLLCDDPFGTIDRFYQYFQSFRKLLEEKESMFASGIDQALQSEVQGALGSAKQELKRMEIQLQQLKQNK